MSTWMQIMAEVRRLDVKRRCGETLNHLEASRLVTMVLEFHRGAVVKIPTPSSSADKAKSRATGGRH